LSAPSCQEGAGDPRIGSVLRDRYRIERLLGAGGMALVYAGSHRNGNRVAIKMLRTELARDPKIRERFLREGYAANAVGHAGVVSVLDDDVTDDGAAFMVMELLEGASVASLLEREFDRKLGVRVTMAIAHELLDVLASAHENGITHRDVKPENVFITTEGKVKLLDFGIARAFDARSTSPGAVIGTPGFMPPEQAVGNNERIDARTDLWAVGATMFRLLAGREVHEGNAVAQVLVRTASVPAAPIGSLVPDLHASLAHVIDRALAFERDDRWASAAEMNAALRTAYASVFGQPLRPHGLLAEAVAPPATDFADTLPHDYALARPTPAMAAAITVRRRAWLRPVAAVAALSAILGAVAAMRLLPARAAEAMPTVAKTRPPPARAPEATPPAAPAVPEMPSPPRPAYRAKRP
jgi:serine/threonine-protein kinase